MSSGRYESSDNTSLGTAVTFLLIGIGAGALAALVLAPKTGKQFRRDLKRGYEDAKETGPGLDRRSQGPRPRCEGTCTRWRPNAGASFADDLREKAEPLAARDQSQVICLTVPLRTPSARFLY